MLKLFIFVPILFNFDVLCKKVAPLSYPEAKLVSVAVIFRHGDRAPIKTYPNDPYAKASFWPVPFGHLTNVGKMQHFELGQWLRKRYNDFLSPQYSKSDIYIRSTDIDRTLMSAQANLAGLFPPQADQVWNENLNWQPIPIHTTTKQNDNILAMKVPCERHNFNLKKLLTSPEFIKINIQNQELYDYLTRKTGSTIKNLDGVQHIYSTLLIESLHNFTLPRWAGKVFPEKLQPLAGMAFALPCYKPELARLRIGPLLNDILDRFDSRKHKFLMYSAHDTTVANILTSLNLFDYYHKPPYAATVIFELHSLGGNYFINILYKNSSVPQKLTLKGCDYSCPLDEFEKIVKPIRINPEEWKSECEMKLIETVRFDILQSTVFVSCMGLLLILLGSLVVSLVCMKMRNRKPGYVELRNENTHCYF